VQKYSPAGQRKMTGDYEPAEIDSEIFPTGNIPQLDRERWWVIMSCQELVQKYSLDRQRKMAGDYEPAGISAEIFPWWAEKYGGWLWAARD
jgi:hypothetical protein